MIRRAPVRAHNTHGVAVWHIHQSVWLLWLLTGTCLAAEPDSSAKHNATAQSATAQSATEQSDDEPMGAAQTVLRYAVVPLTDQHRADFHLGLQSVQGVVSGPVLIAGSERVDPAALREAAWIVDQMLATAQPLQRGLKEYRAHITVMAASEMTTDVAETADLRPRAYWDRRARGMGNVRWCTVGEENLLAFPGDPYSTEGILVHEFAHLIHNGVLEPQPAMQGRILAAFARAEAAGLWRNTYAASNVNEFFAEATQSWFDCNREPDGEHNEIDTRAELIEYQPDLAELLSEVYGANEWRYVSLARRPEAEHLAGWSLQPDQKFEWPAELLRQREELFESGVDVPFSSPPTGYVPLEPLAVSQDTLISSHTGDRSSLLILNRTPYTIEYLWLTPEGEQKSYGTVQPGGWELSETYAGHRWLMRTKAGEVLGLFEAQGTVCRAVVRLPATAGKSR